MNSGAFATLAVAVIDRPTGHARGVIAGHPRPYLLTGAGGAPAGAFEDNVRKWSGDHIIDPLLVPGVLFMNRPFRAAGADLKDMAPTLLDALGVPKGPAMEGDSLLR